MISDEIINSIKKVIDLPKKEEEKFIQILKPVHLKKGDFFISEGQVPKKFGMVIKGLFRYFYIDKKGNEFTKNFMPEGRYISAYSAMISQSPSKMFIEAMEDSMVMEINYNDWVDLKKGHCCWSQYLVFILENAFYIKEKRERELLLLDAQERYEIFKSEYSTLEARVKQHMIASYLGISPVSLSRLKNNSKC